MPPARWNTSPVRYRIEDCRQEIESVLVIQRRELQAYLIRYVCMLKLMRGAVQAFKDSLSTDIVLTGLPRISRTQDVRTMTRIDE